MNPTKLEEELHQLLRRLHEPPATADEIARLDAEGWITDADAPSVEDRGKFLAEQVMSWRPQKAAKNRPQERSDLRCRFDERANALSRVVAADLARDPQVLAFRRDHLAGGLLDPKTVGRWIHERVAEIVPGPDVYAYLCEMQPDQLMTLPYEEFVTASDRAALEVTRIKRRGGTVPPELEELAKSGDGTPPERIEREHDFPCESRTTGPLWVLGSCSAILELKRGWTMHEATTFVLTDITPSFAPIVIEYGRSGHEGAPATDRLMFTVDPMVDSALLIQALVDTRRSSNRKPRLMDPKNVALAQFTATPPGAELSGQTMDQWNARYPEWAYTPTEAAAASGQSRRRTIDRFKLDSARARRHLLNPAPIAR